MNVMSHMYGVSCTRIVGHTLSHKYYADCVCVRIRIQSEYSILHIVLMMSTVFVSFVFH